MMRILVSLLVIAFSLVGFASEQLSVDYTEESLYEGVNTDYVVQLPADDLRSGMQACDDQAKIRLKEIDAAGITGPFIISCEAVYFDHPSGDTSNSGYNLHIQKSRN